MGGCPRGVTVKAMDCGIVVCKFIFQSRYYVHFRANTLKKYHYCSSRRTALALNNLKRVDMPLNKETMKEMIYSYMASCISIKYEFLNRLILSI